MKKRVILWIMLLLPGTAGVFAQSGTTGPLTWTLDNGTLTISGKGAMPDYGFFSHAPWSSCRSDITTAVIGDGVTSIGYYTFSVCNRLTAIHVAEDNTAYASVNGVLFNKAKTTLIQYPAGKQDVNYAIPNSVTSIGDYAFSRCYALRSVTSLNPTPPNIRTSPYIFDGIALSRDTLYVPAASIDAYKLADGWKEFGTVRAYSPTAK
jgi:hypothetical protein